MCELRMFVNCLTCRVLRGFSLQELYETKWTGDVAGDSKRIYEKLSPLMPFLELEFLEQRVALMYAVIQHGSSSQGEFKGRTIFVQAQLSGWREEHIENLKRVYNSCACKFDSNARF